MATEREHMIFSALSIAKEQQQQISMAIETLNETLEEFKKRTQILSTQTQQQLHHHIRTVDIGQILGGRLSDSLVELNQQVLEGKRQVQLANVEVSSARQALHHEFHRLKKQRVWLVVPSFIAGLFLGGVVVFMFLGGLSEQAHQYQELEARYSEQFRLLGEKIDELTVKSSEKRKGG
ncbi:hypothetical protein [Providencia manganoxydans]|uniref:hypothetical protein n=1 Tax=Providencia manganoxydans TaxID=2923283 RepID=UPI0032DB4627